MSVPGVLEVNIGRGWLSRGGASVEFPPFALIHRTNLQRICGNRDNPSRFRGLAIEIPVTLVPQSSRFGFCCPVTRSELGVPPGLNGWN